MQNVTVLGATGSIGLSTLDVISRHPDRFRAYALTGHSRLDVLFEQCEKFRPRYAVVASEQDAASLASQLGAKGIPTEVLWGVDGLVEVSAHPDVDAVMAAIVGAAGLLPTLAAARAGKRVLLANKEALVMSGELFMNAVRDHGAELLPIDSEHNAIFQCLPVQKGGALEHVGVERILLTASGGPFRTWTLEQMAHVTPEQAVRHPNWSMGRKISVDSASLMNKGLEFIEACWLFDARPDQVQVVVHPQSVIHSMVQYVDGSTLAQLGNPDMRTPIAYGLGWPERIHAGVSPLDLVACGRLEFEAPDEHRFPALRLAREAMVAGGTAPAVLNAANEVAVEAFLQNKTSFNSIPAIIANTLEKLPVVAASSLDDVLEADRSARVFASQLVSGM